MTLGVQIECIRRAIKMLRLKMIPKILDSMDFLKTQNAEKLKQLALTFSLWFLLVVSTG